MEQKERPKITIHIALSVDNRYTGFIPDMQTYYQLAGEISHDAVLIGSNTAKSGMELFMEEIPKETQKDFTKNIEKTGPLWILPDSKGILLNLLHVIRQSEYCKELIVLCTKKTPKKYLFYLQERDYEYIITDGDYVDYNEAFHILFEKYNIKTIRSDSGGTLNSILINHGLADELSLFFSPQLIGQPHPTFFDQLTLEKPLQLQLIENKTIKKTGIHIRYKIKSEISND